MHRVFVYGSLKRGYHNNRLLENSIFLGEKVTYDQHYVMHSLGSFPGVVKSDGSKSAAIYGELYEVDDLTFNRLDMLESNGSFYNRELIKLVGEEQPAWMYILLRGDRWDFCKPLVALNQENLSFYSW